MSSTLDDCAPLMIKCKTCDIEKESTHFSKKQMKRAIIRRYRDMKDFRAICLECTL